jgi:uncharacterized RDD family membrane protein YckC
MYQVVDSSGQIFGPVPLETLRQWAAENRITPQTVLIDQSTGAQAPAWQMLSGLGVFPEAAPIPPAAAPQPGHAAPRPEMPAAQVQPISYAYKGSTEPGMPPLLMTRFVAFLIDYLFALMVYSIFDNTFSILMQRIDDAGSWAFWGYLRYFYPAVMMAFLLVRDALFPGGQSVGKRIARIKVQSTLGQPVTIVHSVIRNFSAIPLCLVTIKYVGAWVGFPLTMLLILIEAFMVLTTGQRLGDKVAHTTVVNE